MKFLVDECCDAGLVASLREAGHDVLYVMEIQPGLPDKDVLQRAYREKRVVITEDKDFGELAYRLKKPAAAIVLIRIRVEDRNLKWPRLQKLIENHGDSLPAHFIIVSSDKFRFRPLLFNP